MSSIAIFSTYSPSEGFGGPARTYHQRLVLESAGHSVTHVVLESNPGKGTLRGNDLVQLVERPFREHVDHIYNDVDLGKRARQSSRVMRHVEAHLRRHAVDLIILEQPFLVDVVAAMASTLVIPVIYSCQNVEYRLRRSLERFQFMLDRPTTRGDEVREIEVRAVELAAAVTTICPTDQLAMRSEFGCDSVIVPNGTTVANQLEHGPVGSDDPVDFVFAGSSYWPNVEGFAKIAEPSLAFLPPTTRIHVIGSVCNDLLGVPSVARRHSINASRLTLRGFLPMSELIATMAAARSVLVPVFVGEGSNLKSADALAAGVPVIMTRRATRGYEDVLSIDPEGVTITDDASGFREAMTEAMTRPWPTTSIGERRRQELSWSARLQPLVGVVNELFPRGDTA